MNYKEKQKEYRERLKPKLSWNSSEKGTFKHRHVLQQIVNLVKSGQTNIEGLGEVSTNKFKDLYKKSSNRRAQLIFKNCWKTLKKKDNEENKKE